VADVAFDNTKVSTSCRTACRTRARSRSRSAPRAASGSEPVCSAGEPVNRMSTAPPCAEPCSTASTPRRCITCRPAGSVPSTGGRCPHPTFDNLGDFARVADVLIDQPVASVTAADVRRTVVVDDRVGNTWFGGSGLGAVHRRRRLRARRALRVDTTSVDGPHSTPDRPRLRSSRMVRFPPLGTASHHGGGQPCGRRRSRYLVLCATSAGNGVGAGFFTLRSIRLAPAPSAQCAPPDASAWYHIRRRHL